MTRRVPINNVDHADLRVALRHGAAFGDAVNQVPVFPTEFEEGQREFPILFRRSVGGLEAVALLGLDRDENLFLDGDRWTSRHIPLVQQRGPFSLAVGAGEATGEAPQIHLDLDDPRVGAQDGEPLFRAHGGNGVYLDHAARVLRSIHAGVEAGRTMYPALDAAGLIQPVALEIELSAEQRYRIPNHHAISRERLAALDGPALAALHRAGFLAAAFLLLASLGNIQSLINSKLRREGRA